MIHMKVVRRDIEVDMVYQCNRLVIVAVIIYFLIPEHHYVKKITCKIDKIKNLLQSNRHLLIIY